MTNYTIKKETRLPHSEIEMEVVIETEEIEKFRSHTLEHINQDIALPGFRKGHIPPAILTKKVGELFILEEMSDHALQEIVPQIVLQKKLDVLGKPRVKLTKLAVGNPVEFTVTFQILPDVQLPAYKKIAAEKNKTRAKDLITIEEKDVEEVVQGIRKNFAKKEGEEEILPELNDEFVKKLGTFKDVTDFRAHVKENLLKERESRAKEKNRIEVVEAIIEKSSIEVPPILIESELDRMEYEFKNDTARMGVKFDEYLTHIKKTLEDIRNDWKEDAKKRVLFQLVIGKIAELEKIAPDETRVAKEVAHLLEHHKDADPNRARSYVAHLLTTEEVFTFLLNQ